MQGRAWKVPFVRNSPQDAHLAPGTALCHRCYSHDEGVGVGIQTETESAHPRQCNKCWPAGINRVPRGRGPDDLVWPLQFCLPPFSEQSSARLNCWDYTNGFLSSWFLGKYQREREREGRVFIPFMQAGLGSVVSLNQESLLPSRLPLLQASPLLGSGHNSLLPSQA